MRNVLFVLMLFVSSVNAQSFRANICDFGAVSNDGKDDTEAIEKAVRWVRSKTVAFLMKHSSYVGCAPVLYFPPGYYKIKRQIRLTGYMAMTSDAGKAIIQWHPLEPDKGKRQAMFLFQDCYTNTIENLKFIGGGTCLEFKNANIDKTVIEITSCEFLLSKGTAIKATPLPGSDHLSALLTIQNCRFIDNFQCLETYCDITRIVDSWVSLCAPYANMNGAVFVNKSGKLILTNLVGVPGVCKSVEVMQKPHKLRWVDNYSEFYAAFSRFGGEGAGMPIVYNFAKNSCEYPYMDGGVIVISASSLCSGSSRKDACVIRLFEVPAMIVLRDNVNLINAPIIRVDPSLDIDAYLAEIPPHKQNFVYKIDANRMWPATLVDSIPKSLKKFLK